MFLKSLTLKGFKSFADSTTIELEPGVTVVVGPNGSGKSNVVDAIAWVLGAQAPSAVRSQKMDDVIFAGTKSRPALGRAEVGLTLDNSTGVLPIEFTEVTVSRTLFRTGESEYAINGVPCRLLDVQELLSDAGVGRQQHVIVSQGQIDAVLNARPEDRRAIIEEAAGVLKHRKRKEKAERRLEGTEASMLRANDLLREVKRNLRPLERQADAARRHGSLVAELRALQIHLAGRELRGHRTRLEALAGDRLAGEEAERALRAQLTALDSAVMTAEAQLTAAGDSGVNDELVRIERLRGRARAVSAVVAERRRSVERDRGVAMGSDVVASLEADAASTRTELDSVLTMLDQVESATRAGVTTGESLGSLEEAHRATERVGVLNAEVRRLNDEIDRMRGLVSRDEANERELVVRLGEAADSRTSADAALEAALALQSTAHADATTSAARLDALRLAADSNAAGVDALRGIDGALATLGELIEIDAERRVAVQVALAEALGAVVARNADAARRALQELRQRAKPGAVLALNAIATVPATPIVERGSSLREHVRARAGELEAPVNRLLDVLLARVVFVSSWSEGVDAALAHPDAVVVTADGDRFAASGLRVGAGAGTPAALDDARIRAERAADALARADADLASARTRAAQARDAHTAALTLLERHRAQAGANASGLSAAYDSLRSVQAELQGLLSVLRNDLEVKTAGLQERRQFLAARLTDIESRLAADVVARREAAERRTRIEAQMRALDRLGALVDGHVAALDAREAELSEIRRRQSEANRAISERLETARRERSTKERELEERRERNRRVEVEEAEVKMRLEAVTDVLRRDHAVEPDSALDAPLPELADGVTPVARVRELERELRVMGPINPLALEEYTELQKRHEFLEAELADVRDSRRELQKVIKQVDLEIQSTFAAAFADVSANFDQIFSMLFPGGQGRLILTNPNDLLNTGIEVEAKPSGKNIRKLSLLSGGERSMAAIAFLFAVFRSRPSPFYVMDEVEAALDDVNLHRFLHLLNEFRRDAQLLVVSHQKRTMEAGDCLLGVSMQPGGSSKVVVERARAASA